MQSRTRSALTGTASADRLTAPAVCRRSPAGTSGLRTGPPACSGGTPVTAQLVWRTPCCGCIRLSNCLLHGVSTSTSVALIALNLKLTPRCGGQGCAPAWECPSRRAARARGSPARRTCWRWGPAGPRRQYGRPPPAPPPRPPPHHPPGRHSVMAIMFVAMAQMRLLSTAAQSAMPAIGVASAWARRTRLCTQ